MDRRLRGWGIVSIALLAGCYCGHVHQDYWVEARPASMDEVVKLAKAGVPDKIIVAKIKNDGIAAPPTTDDILALRKDGISDTVLETLMSARVRGEKERYFWRGYPQPFEPLWYEDEYRDSGWGWYYPHWHPYGGYRY